MWALLPAFRAVAETEHLPTAARALDLVPSSLSRAIRQLEEALGAELFDHTGKSLVLNEHGRVFLAGVRAAMRLVDESVRQVSGDVLSGAATMAIADEVSSSLLGPACAALHQRYPALAVATVGVADPALDSLLLRGGADVAVVTRPIRDAELAVVELTRLRRGAYVSREKLPADNFPYVVVGTRSDPLPDGWPVARPRRIAMWTHCERIALEACLHGHVAIVATDHAAAPYASRLARLPIEDIGDQALYLAFRRPLGVHLRTETLVTAIRESVRSHVEGATP
ncbi:MAG: LysR family transcriptional regulator [Kofleriaceae bacterium]